jgi:hypothetical protein
MIFGISVCLKMDEKGLGYRWGRLPHSRLQTGRVSFGFPASVVDYVLEVRVVVLLLTLSLHTSSSRVAP